MARRIPLAKIGDYSREKYEKLLREVVFETDRQLKDGSPVDTGRLRLSWSIGENNTPGYDPGPQSAIPDITPPRRLNYGTERAGNVYHIHTNMEYALPVLYGESLPPSWNGSWRSKKNQIVKGYPDLVARKMTAWVKRVADQIGRQD
jgi:hypothetical protein